MKNRDLPYYPVPTELEGYYEDPKQCLRFIPFTGITKYEHCVLEFAKAIISRGNVTNHEAAIVEARRYAGEYFRSLEDTV